LWFSPLKTGDQSGIFSARDYHKHRDTLSMGRVR
jgi:hypothetical protein